MKLKGKSVAVIGVGKTGLSVLDFLLRKGAHVLAFDARPLSELTDTSTLMHNKDVELVAESSGDERLKTVDLVMVSPGVAPNALLDEVEKGGVQVVSEPELASWYIHAPIIAVTGTNGKSSVTTLIGEMIQRQYPDTFVGGNLGTPLIDVVDTRAASDNGRVVVELSSFQLERAYSLRPHIGVLLNITPDHLDWHGSFAEYTRAKSKLFHAQKKTDFAVIPDNDELCRSLAAAGAASIVTYGEPNGRVRVCNQKIRDDVSGFEYNVHDLKLRGAHNIQNVCAAVLAALLADVPQHHIADVLRSFGGLPHRMFFVRTLDGVAYYDDSKATNVGASVASLQGIDEPVVLIAGGRDKGGSYSPLVAAMKKKGRGLVVIGEAAPLIESAFSGSEIIIQRSESMVGAVKQARAMAQPGDAVLLAPACASFDMFKSYAHRGDEFQRAVMSLEAKS